MLFGNLIIFVLVKICGSVPKAEKMEKIEVAVCFITFISELGNG